MREEPVIKEADIIETWSKLSVSVGRHLYGILGSYAALGRFAAKLCQVKMPNRSFPVRFLKPGHINSIPDAEFKTLAKTSPRPEPLWPVWHRLLLLF